MRKDFGTRTWIIVGIALFSLACLGRGLAAQVSPEPPGMESAVTPFVIPECQHAPGATIELQKISGTLVELIASGLQPGEYPYVYYFTPVGDINPGEGGGFPGARVGEDGKFYSDFNWAPYGVEIMEPPPGETSTTWEIRLIHERGVECATITLP